MKIQSGRIQHAGINPNRGVSLGFYGVGNVGDAVALDANGLPISSSSLPSVLAQTTMATDTGANAVDAPPVGTTTAAGSGVTPSVAAQVAAINAAQGTNYSTLNSSGTYVMYAAFAVVGLLVLKGLSK